ncbi:MAG: NAD(P)/FAD-dependent oxidoreductase [Limnoraphis sp. WC205]|jgi:pyruvate/2-oxoglutarate dehydrogenase complex dihydrolipoamide dehydrogenase (E3) component|nr:NAD(P)/FAD-dependent oxidoreductase [Limnoraphis sp. WC205]
MIDYDVVIIGGSPTGRYAAALATQLQARVALVEPQKPTFAGQCWRWGYSAALLSVGQTVRQIERSQQLGWDSTSDNCNLDQTFSLNWRQTKQWMEAVVSNLEEQDSPAMLAALGVDVIFGQGEFVSQPHLAFVVNQRTLRSRTYLLATASQPKIPEIEGLLLTGFLTAETINKLTRIPEHLAIIGGDPSGTELAQTFARLGSNVTMIIKHDHILGKEDPEAAGLIQAKLEAVGIKILTQTEVIQAQKIQDKKWIQAGNKAIEVDEIIVAAGQQPQLNRLNLEVLGVAFNRQYLRLNEKLQTTHSRIYACGNLSGGYSYPHLANYEATIAVKNALYLPIFQVNYQGVPWAVFSDPQLARVGLTETQAKRRYGDDIIVYRDYFKHLPKAIIEEETVGFFKLIGHQNGEILGASIVGPQASEMISIIALAIRQGLKIQAIAQLPQIWPTFSQMSQQTAIAWLQHQRRCNTLLIDWIENLFHWRRSWSS